MSIPELKDVSGLHFLKTEKFLGLETMYWVAPDADIETIRALLACVTPARDLLFIGNTSPCPVRVWGLPGERPQLRWSCGRVTVPGLLRAASVARRR
jgi:hypothetical protein